MHKYLSAVNQHPCFYRICKNFTQFKQKLKYGFDNREIRNLDYAFYCWLYERVMFILDEIKQGTYSSSKIIYWNGQQYTEEELYNEIAIRLRFYFKSQDIYLFLSDDDKKYIEEIGKMWISLLHSMW